MAACGARPGCSGCSPRASATRSRGSSRARSSCSPPACGCVAVARAPTCAARPTSSGAAGSSSRSSSSRSWPASSTSTTPWPSPRRSVPSSAWVRSRPGSAARARSATIALAAATAAAATWSFILLSRTTAYGDWLRISVLAVGMAAALLILATRWMHARAVPARPRRGARRRPRRPGGVCRVDHRPGPQRLHRDGRSRRVEPWSRRRAVRGRAAAAPARPVQRHDPRVARRRRRGGGMGGLLDASTPSTAVVSALSANADRYTWVAAAVGSQTAAGLQLGTQLPVMAIGGFNGSDPSPTLAQFQQYVANGQIHYFASGGRGFGNQNGGSSASSEISSWVQENFTPVTIDGSTFYDLTQPVRVTTMSADLVAAANPTVAAGRSLRRRGPRVHRPAPRPLRGPGAGRCAVPAGQRGRPGHRDGVQHRAQPGVDLRGLGSPQLASPARPGARHLRDHVCRHDRRARRCSVRSSPTQARPCRPWSSLVANVLSTAARFVAMRRWIFRVPGAPAAPPQRGGQPAARSGADGPPRPGIRDRRRAREPHDER